jgi:acetoin utilization deacetylase AcuC-like enzyme
MYPQTKGLNLKTGLITHPVFPLHNMGEGHPESPLRIEAIISQLKKENIYQYLALEEPEKIPHEILLLGHKQIYLDLLVQNSPQGNEEFSTLDNDTIMNQHTLDAAYFSAGAIKLAIDRIMEGRWKNAFSLARPPGHHAEPDKAMGFCFFSNVALGALYLQKQYGLKKIAIIDFDVHHGNGTEEVIKNHPNILFISTFEFPLFPDYEFSKNINHIVNLPLKSGTGSKEYRRIIEEKCISKLRDFSPEFILISAGFDAHESDPLANINLRNDDYSWLAKTFRDLAEEYCQGKLLASLEGGYNLKALGESATSFISKLI